MNKLKKIQQIEKRYQIYINRWQSLLDDVRRKIKMEIFALEEWDTCPDPKYINLIELDAELAKKLIRLWEEAKNKKIRAILEDREFENDIDEIFNQPEKLL